MKLQFILNDKAIECDAPSTSPLSEVLRDYLDARQVKVSCGQGYCGTCMVLINDRLSLSCVTPAFAAQNKQVTMAKYILTRPEYEIIEKGFSLAQYLPCASCAPARSLAAWTLITKEESINADTIKRYSRSVFCRCSDNSQFELALSLVYEFKERANRGKR